MKVLLLAAGRGTRLRPITDYIPKPMVPLQGKPLLEWVMLDLISYGIEEYVIAVSYLAEQIINYFGNGDRWGVRIEYSQGESPAGKAGEVWRAREALSHEKSFLVIPGDTICHLDYQDFMAFHERHGGIVSVALSKRYRLEVGVADVDSSGRITAFFEKSNLNQPVSTGAYLLDQAVFSFIANCKPEGKEVDLPAEVFPAILRAGEDIYGFVSDYDWWDVGRINDYEAIAQALPAQAIQILHSHENGAASLYSNAH